MGSFIRSHLTTKTTLSVIALILLIAAAREIGVRTDWLSSHAQALQGSGVTTQDQHGKAPLLALGDSLHQEFSGNKQHSYKIVLDSGQYLRVLVTQSGMELGVTLYAPDGKTLAELIPRQNGPTPVSAIAQVPGIYRLELRSRENEPVQGRYEVTVEEIRRATAKDSHRIAGERAFAKAGELRNEWLAESSRKAVASYEEARQHWKTAGEPREEAKSLRGIGELNHLLGDPRIALNFYQQALVLSKKANDPKGEAEALSGLADAYLHLGQNQKAMEYCANALSSSQASGDRYGEAQSLSNTGKVHYAGLGDLRTSLEYFGRALALWRSIGNRLGEANALLYFGYMYSDLGEAKMAKDFYDRALNLWRSLNDRRGEALTLIAIGHMHSRLGEKQEALDLLNRALELVRPMGDKVSEAAILSKLGWAFYQMGEQQRSLSYYSDGLRLYQSVNFRVGEAALLAEMGAIYYSSRQDRPALDHYSRALALSRAVGDRQIESIALRNMGAIHQSLGQKAQALNYSQQALSLSQACGDRRVEAQTLNNLGRLYESLGKVPVSVDYYNRALLLSRATQDRVGEALALYNTARAERSRGHFTEARLHLEESLRIVESLRTKVASQELRSSYFASERHRYDFYIDLLMQMHKQSSSDEIAADALQASEGARARSLLESLTEAGAGIRQGIDPALLQRERLVRYSLSAKADRQMRLLTGQHAKQEADSLAKEISDLTTAYEDLRAQIRVKNPRYAALTQPQPLSLKEIQQQVLDDDSLLLEYSLGDERSYLWAVTRTGIKSYELPKGAEIEKLARGVYDLLSTRQARAGETARQHQIRVSKAEAQYWVQAAVLSQTLLGPVEPMLGTKRLLIVAEGALQYLPFGALPKPRREGAGREAGSQGQDTQGLGGNGEHVITPLIVDHEIVPLPSASVMAVLRRETRQRQAPAKTVAVFADPVFDTDDPRIAPEVTTRLKAEEAKKSKANGTAQPKAGSSFLPAAPRISTVPRRPSTHSSEIRTLRDGLSRLLFSRREAEGIIAVTPPGQGRMMVTDFNANRTIATSPELSQYRIVHFATHGVLDDQNPGLSGIILSLVDEQGRPQDGFLRLNDIYNLGLKAELVVLSACETALGKDVRGEGLVGIVRGFMYAGAARVVASLWKVDDEATAEVMKRFYQHMLQDNMPAAAALRAAQMDISKQKQWRSPYYWAAFVLQGEWK